MIANYTDEGTARETQSALAPSSNESGATIPNDMKRYFRKIASRCCILILAVVSGCKQKPSDDEAVRAAVRQHLSSLGTLNMQAFDTDFTTIVIQNNQATADVSFRPKTGAPAGAAMQVSYQLEKLEGNWRVVKKSTASGMIQHPGPNANPHAQGEVHGKLPNF